MILMPVSDHAGRCADGDAEIGDIACDDGVSADHAVAANSCSEYHDVLANPRAVADADRATLNQVLRLDRLVDVFVSVHIVGDIDPIGDQYVASDLDRVGDDNMRTVADVNTVPDIKSGLHGECVNCLDPCEIVNEDVGANRDVVRSVDPDWPENAGTCPEPHEEKGYVRL